MTESATYSGSSRSRIILRNLLAFVLGVVVIYFITNAVVGERLGTVREQVQLTIAEQQSILTSVAEVTARGGADEVVSSIITDCSTAERAQFDRLLSSLDRGLTQAQLSELARLFDRCGGFFAERKAVMVARLEREMEVFRDYVALLNSITGQDLADEYEVAEWQSLVTEEKRQSQLFSRLVELQGDIITTLEAGNQPSSEAITELLTEVQEVRETLAVATMQAAELRSSLSAL